ncbi:hypothetical protein B0H21DRAFT_169703 [Amylocystis lapponica]|nr:hypothetical protein B0H21DRAFT_169703 [Amylocystis lapponica]
MALSPFVCRYSGGIHQQSEMKTRTWLIGSQLRSSRIGHRAQRLRPPHCQFRAATFASVCTLSHRAQHCVHALIVCRRAPPPLPSGSPLVHTALSGLGKLLESATALSLGDPARACGFCGQHARCGILDPLGRSSLAVNASCVYATVLDHVKSRFTLVRSLVTAYCYVRCGRFVVRYLGFRQYRVLDCRSLFDGLCSLLICITGTRAIQSDTCCGFGG